MAHLIYLKSISFSNSLRSASNVQIGLKCTDRAQMYVHLRPICSLIGSDTSHEKINYFCLKCMEFCTFEADSEIDLKCTAV